MYQSYYGMSCNPFSKEVDIHHSYESHDFKELIYRFQYLTEIKGIGVFTGCLLYTSFVIFLVF